YIVQRFFPRMPERSVPQIMSQSDRLHKIFVEPQRLGNCPCILRYFQCMGQTGPVVIPFGQEKYLRLLLQPSECLTVQDPVPVPLKDRTDVALRLLPLTPPCIPAQRGIWAEILFFPRFKL